MMAGLADDVDAVLFIGYHGRAGTPQSVLPHTINSRVIADVRYDGQSLGELGLNAALAAHHDVPAVLVSGDDSVAVEAAEVAPGIHTVVVKRALGARAAASCIRMKRRRESSEQCRQHWPIVMPFERYASQVRCCWRLTS
jgi:D-amino peptidase